MRKKKKNLGFGLIAILIILGIASYFSYVYYHDHFSPNIQKDGKLYIPTNATYQQVLDSIKPFLIDEKSFDKISQKINYPSSLKAGRYSIREGENNKELIQRLKLGLQDEIAIRIGNYSSIEQLAGRIAPFLESDSVEILSAIVHSEYSKNLDTSGMTYFLLPNTYNFHWNTSGKQFVDRMEKEYKKFWTPERLKQAGDLDMSAFQVITLASIVQLESSKADEQPAVAGLYLNRLKIGMKLDADPTVIFAMKLENPDQEIKRVYFKNLRIHSLYNTYIYPGIPPGPICMPNPSAIDAVLQPDDHDYFYFVADPEKAGYHIFARNLQEHEANAKKYRAWLNSKEIK